MGDAIGPDRPGMLPPAAWYRDPWRLAPLRWWDGRNWTSFTSPGPGAPSAPGAPAGAGFGQLAAAQAPWIDRPTMPQGVGDALWGSGRGEPLAQPATPVEPAKRRWLWAELLIVLAIFPFPYVVNAVAVLIQAVIHAGSSGRFPVPFPSHLGLSFLIDILLALEPLAAAALVAYLLSISGEGGGRAIGIDRSDPRRDLALLLPVFLLCFLIPQVGVSLVLNAVHVRAIAPASQNLPGYFSIVGVVTVAVSAVVEEVVVLGFLIRRLEQLGLGTTAVVAIAVLVRISYHLYYGWGVLPILAWAFASVLMYRRFRRLGPFIFVHLFWDLGLILQPFFGSGPLVAEVLVLTPSTFVFWLLWRNRLSRL